MTLGPDIKYDKCKTIIDGMSDDGRYEILRSNHEMGKDHPGHKDRNKG